MAINSNLSNVLDIEDASYDLLDDDALPPPVFLPPTTTDSTELVVQNQESDERVDYRAARKNLKELVETGQEALESILAVAQDTDSPRAFEVVAKLLDTVGNLAEKAYNIHHKVKEAGIINDIPQQVNVEKAVFIGTSADMLSKLKESNEI